MTQITLCRPDRHAALFALCPYSDRMHEVGIAASVLDAVRAQVAQRSGVRATAVGVRIGALAGVDAESLRFGFDALVNDSDLEPLRLEIEPADADELDLVWVEVEDT